MRIDIAAPDAWGKLSERYRASLPEHLQDPGLNVFIFNGAAHAVTELTKAVSQLYTNKKKIALVTEVDPSFDSIAVAFSQEEFEVKLITPKQALDAATWTPLVDELLFVLVSEDDPITGRLINLETLNQAMKGKRVFKILVSHALHTAKPIERPEPFTAKIISLDPERALLIGGERCRMQPQVAASIHWKDETDDEIKQRLAPLTGTSLSTVADSKSKIETFEAKLPSGFKRYFSADEARLFDRSVFYHPEFDGLSVIDELSSTMRTPIHQPGQSTLLETTSACRWESPRFQEWLIARGETESTIKGLVVASAELIDQGLATHLETAAAKIDRIQKGN